MTVKLNDANFPEGINLWVSEKCTSKKTGKTTYWGAIDEFENGALLYLSHSVWENLDTVNRDTVLNKLLDGGFEITEAHSLETGELLVHETTGEQIYQISKSRETAHGKFRR